jgi:S1-C subfamily serine protease
MNTRRRSYLRHLMLLAAGLLATAAWAEDVMLTPDTAFLLPLPGYSMAVMTVSEEPAGIEVVKIFPRAAEDSLVVIGDIIVAIEGETVTTIAAIRKRFDAIEVGTPVQFKVLRAGKTLEVTVPKAELPQNG